MPCRTARPNVATESRLDNTSDEYRTASPRRFVSVALRGTKWREADGVEAVPDVHYARAGDVNIAYTRWGQGSHVVVYTPPLASNVESFWELPEWVRTARYAGEYMQLVQLDKRGVGLSDRVAEPPSIDDRVVDTLAVMDAEGLGTVNLIGHSEGGGVAIALAARHPERVRSMVVIGAPASGAPTGELAALADASHPFPDEVGFAETLRELVRNWGAMGSVNLELIAPRAAADSRIRRWYQRFERHSATPAALLGFLRSFANVDLRPMLARIAVPTFVVHSRGDRLVHVANGRYLAAAIPGAQYTEYDIDDHLWQLAPEWRQVEDDVIAFVTGRRPAPPRTAFATVVFTDIVSSTAREASVGNERWRRQLDTHDRIAHELITLRGGSIIKHIGDGLFATFSDPADAVTSTVDFVAELNKLDLGVRAGIHIGHVIAREDGDISGIAVNIAARVQGLCEPNEVLVSQTVRDLLLGTDVHFVERGTHELRGLDGTWQLYAVTT